MKLLTLSFVLALACGLTSLAGAAPTLFGPEGLLNTPTAQTLEEDAYALSLHTLEHSDSLGYALNYGIRPGLEVGFTRLTSGQTVVNAKYALHEETESRVGLAVGAIDLTDQVKTSLYAVASTRIDPGDLYGVDNFHVNLGIAAGGGSGTSVPLSGLFGGLSFDIAHRVTVMVEDDGDSLNYGARLMVAPGLLATAGVVGDDENLALQLSYNGQF